MIEKIKRYFGWKPDDWYPVWNDSAYWQWDDGQKEYVFYRIDFSPERNEYKLVHWGKSFATYMKADSYTHPFYKIACDKLIELENGRRCSK